MNNLENQNNQEVKKVFERGEVIDHVINLIIDEMTEEGKGNLTTTFVIGVLKDAIRTLEFNALMKPAISLAKKD